MRVSVKVGRDHLRQQGRNDKVLPRERGETRPGELSCPGPPETRIQQMTARTIAIRSIAVIGATIACRPSSDSAPPPPSQQVDSATKPISSAAPDSAQATGAAPRDSVARVLETGCAGGATGGGGGTFVTADGRFYRYQRNGPAPNAKRELTFVHRDSARAASLVQAAEREGIMRIRFSEPSNMTCHLTLERGGTSYEIAWPMGRTPPAISKLVAVATELETAAASR